MPRISTIQVYDRSKASVGEARQREAKTAEKASTLKEIVRPSDDPRGWAVAQQIKDDIEVQEVLARNGALAQQVLGATEQIFRGAIDHIERAYELGLASIYKGEDVQRAALDEIRELYQGFIHTLNTRFGNRTLLGGFRSDRPAFSENGMYHGDNGKIEVELERGQQIALNITGDEAILGTKSERGVNIPQVFLRLMEGLEDADHDLIGSTFEDFQAAVSQISGVRTEIGARMNRIERAISTGELDRIERKGVVAHLEEADPVKVFTDLARDQTALKASLDTAYKIMNEVPPDKLFR